MKKIITFICLSLLFFGCKKKDELPVKPTTNTEVNKDEINTDNPDRFKKPDLKMSDLKDK